VISPAAFRSTVFALLGGLCLVLLAAMSAGQNPSQNRRLPTGLLMDDVYLGHLEGVADHPERPERLLAIRMGLSRSGLMSALYRIMPRRVTDAELRSIHSSAYIDLVRRELANVRGTRELSTGDTLASARSLESAEYAAGGVLNAIDAVLARRARNAFCAVRPPGHHATPTRGMGFCIFNNVAIAAKHLQKNGIKRVLIVDWDYHHGNGTQDAFYGDDSVLIFDTHHYGAYPGTGSPAETGEGKAVGTKLNVAMPSGAGDAEFVQAFRMQLVPAARKFKPDFILISAGFDGMRNDVLGRFDITPEGFAAMTRVVVDLANELCQGRVVSVLEGGYRLDGLSDSVVAHVRTLQNY
jgi:acetoin utilization deacetylase AcuC-like enzyme